MICMSFTLQVTCTRINVNGCHWNTCKLVFTGTRKWILVHVNTALHEAEYA